MGRFFENFIFTRNDRYDVGKPHPNSLPLGEEILFFKNKNGKVDKNINL
jgi:hypothetical protein